MVFRVSFHAGCEQGILLLTNGYEWKESSNYYNHVYRKLVAHEAYHVWLNIEMSINSQEAESDFAEK